MSDETQLPATILSEHPPVPDLPVEPPKMSAAFLKAIDFILPHEEEFARGHWGDEKFVVTENVSGDSGGLTKYGIDHKSHPHVDIASLTKEQAIAIYYEEWLDHQLDELPWKLAICAFDVWVNGGHANLWLQRAYNAINTQATPLVEDGVLGPKSLAALSTCDQDEIVRKFIGYRDARFKALANDPLREQFLAGWLDRDKDLSKALLA